MGVKKEGRCSIIIKHLFEDVKVENRLRVLG
jgi:hypothetical protein